MTKKWMSSNGWKIGMAIVAGLVAWTALKNDVDKWMKPAIAANTQAVEVVKDRVVDVEKDIIGVKSSIDRNTESVDEMKAQQISYHSDAQGYREARDLKLAAILSAVEKGNERP